MKIRDARVSSVAFDIRGVANARVAHSRRNAVVVRLVDERGHEGVGEASPLPGHSVDDAESCLRALASVDWSVIPGNADLRGLLEAARAVVPTSVPAARFAVESALIDLHARGSGVPAWSLFDESAQAVPLAALVGDAAGAKRAANRGIRTAKLKIGLRPLVEEIATAHACSEHVTLRLDANQSLEPGDLDALAVVRMSFVEEPCEPAKLLDAHELPVRIALDESLARPELAGAVDQILARHRVAAFALKPMMLGGFSSCLELAERARARGIHCYVSHLFGGPIAHAAESTLALALSKGCEPAGLDRHAGLDGWGSAELALLGEHAIVPAVAPGLGVELNG